MAINFSALETPEVETAPVVNDDGIDFTALNKKPDLLDGSPLLEFLSDNDDKVTFGGIAKQFAIGAANSALLDIPLVLAGEEKREQLESSSRPERIARGAGTVAGFFTPGGLSKLAFKTGEKAGGKILTRLAAKKGGELAAKASRKEVAKRILVRRVAKSTAETMGGAAFYETVRATDDPKEKLLTVPLAVGVGAALGVARVKLDPLFKKVGFALDTAIKKGDAKKVEALKNQFIQSVTEESKIVAGKINEAVARKDYSTAYRLINENFRSHTRAAYLKMLKKLDNEAKDTAVKLIEDKSLSVKGANFITEPSKRTKVVGTKQHAKIKSNKMKQKLNSGEMEDVVEAQLDGFVPPHVIKNDIMKNIANIQRRNAVTNNPLFQGSDVYLNKQGSGGRELTRVLKEQRYRYQTRLGGAIADYEKSKLSKLNGEQKTNLVALLEGRATQPLDDNVAEVANYFKRFRKDIINEGKFLNLNLQERKNYFPHINLRRNASRKSIKEMAIAARDRGDFGSEKEAADAFKIYTRNLEKPDKLDEPFMKILRRFNAGKTDDELRASFNQYSQEIQTKSFGNLERQRTINLPFWDSNPDTVIPRYMAGALNAIEEARYFGVTTSADGKVVRGENLTKLINLIDENGGDSQFAKLLVERQLGLNQSETLLGKTIFKNALSKSTQDNLSKGIRSFQIVTKLGLGTTIANASQSANTVLRTNLKEVLFSLGRIMRPASKQKMRDFAGHMITPEEFALRTGSTAENVMRGVIAEATGSSGGMAQIFLDKIGFTFVERMNRTIAANAGAEYARALGNNLIKKPSNKAVHRQLSRLGLNPKKILQNGGLDFDDFVRAGRKVVADTQFLTDPIDVPIAFSSPEGKVLFQFKNFAFKQSRFIKDEVLKEAKRGNIAPLATGLALFPVIGEGVGNIKAILAGRDRNSQGLSRLAENYAAVGGAGLIYDFYLAAKWDQELRFIAGPTGSDILKTIQILNIADSDRQKFERDKFLARQVPLAGPTLRQNIIRRGR